MWGNVVTNEGEFKTFNLTGTDASNGCVVDDCFNVLVADQREKPMWKRTGFNPPHAPVFNKSCCTEACDFCGDRNSKGKLQVADFAKVLPIRF